MPPTPRLQADLSRDVLCAAQSEDPPPIIVKTGETPLTPAGCCTGCLILFIISTSNPQPPADKKEEC